MKTFRNIFYTLLLTLLLCLVGVFVCARIPFVQKQIAGNVAEMLSREFKTEVSIERILLSGWLYVDVRDLTIDDQQSRPLLHTPKMGARLNPWSLLQGKIRISTAEINALELQLCELDSLGKRNYQFLIDALSSSDNEEPGSMDIRLANLSIRGASISYLTYQKKLYRVQPLNGQIAIKQLTPEQQKIRVRRLSLNEGNGFCINNLGFDLLVRGDTIRLSDATIELPHSTVDFSANALTRGNTTSCQLQAQGYLTPSDLTSFVPDLKNATQKINLNAKLLASLTDGGLQKAEADFFAGDPTGSYSLEGTTAYTPTTLNLDMQRIHISAPAIRIISQALKPVVNLPEEISRLGRIDGRLNLQKTNNRYKGTALLATDIGDIIASVQPSGNQEIIEITSSGLKVNEMLQSNLVGEVAGKAQITLTNNQPTALNALLDWVVIDGKTYTDITLEGHQSGSGEQQLLLTANDAQLCGEAELERNGSNLRLQINNLYAELKNKETVRLNQLILEAQQGDNTEIRFTSDFGEGEMKGQFNYQTIITSFTNTIRRYLPTLPWLPPHEPANNQLTLDATLHDTQPLAAIFALPFSSKGDIKLLAQLNDANEQFLLHLNAPEMTYAKHHFKNARLEMTTRNGILQSTINLQDSIAPEAFMQYDFHASAHANKLLAQCKFDSNYGKRLRGLINTQTNFALNDEGLPTASVRILPSDIVVEDSIWKLHPANINYHQGHISINDLAISHAGQHLRIDGSSTRQQNDSIAIELQNMNIAYIMDLINFHSVEFDGAGSGQAIISQIFDQPEARAHLQVDNFRFERGRMGTLLLDAHYDNSSKRILIAGKTSDGPFHRLDIDGYVAPDENYIDLALHASNAPAEFLQKICGGFMSHVDMTATGQVNLCGPLNDIGLIGQLSADGSFLMRPFGTTYQLHKAPILFMPYTFKFEKDTLYDATGHYATIDGTIRHRNLGHMQYDIQGQLREFQVFNFPETRENTFSGHVGANGNCHIHGTDANLNVDINLTPTDNSVFTYNASSPEEISETHFISWNDTSNPHPTASQSPISALPVPLPTINTQLSSLNDLHINFLINATPSTTLKVIMDDKTGDNISICGEGVLRCHYYNKGPFHIFGNYIVDHGIYKLTIQNIIKRDFQLQPGGTITFGGEPYDAPISLKAQYTVNGVSLADLHVGKSFSNNNIRVNCLMNITGTPNAPKVDFGLEFPSLGTDARRMINSLINSQEEMNQQVLYLLAIGRFYSQNSNNQESETTQTQSQTSLAMQSILSGTLSQQINNVLSSVVNNTNWNFGANISTGDEGWNNAEYEGILSGRMLNNRLLFNGQFGYRDNANATTSFIGDFDLRYLLYPNGNLAIRVYNETSERYFTKNSLNTQGIGLIIKKDFTSWRDLLGIKPKKSETDTLKVEQK